MNKEKSKIFLLVFEITYENYHYNFILFGQLFVLIFISVFQVFLSHQKRSHKLSPKSYRTPYTVYENTYNWNLTCVKTLFKGCNRELMLSVSGEVQARVSVAATAAVLAAEWEDAAVGARAERSEQFPLRRVAPQLHLQLHQECQTHLHLAPMSSAFLSAEKKCLKYFFYGRERNWSRQVETDCEKLPPTVRVAEELRSADSHHPSVSVRVCRREWVL